MSYWGKDIPELDQYHHATNLLFTEERLLNYRKGGLHPVSLGDTFHNGRYQIHHKLGFNTYWTVWLAEDKLLKRWVSIKIMTADETTKKFCEKDTLQSLARYCKDEGEGEDLSSHLIIELLDHFLHSGPNGTHQCLVFELLGPTLAQTLDELIDRNDPELRFEPETIFRISAQLLDAVAFVHKAGYGYGAILATTIRFTSPRLRHLDKKTLLTILGTPEIETLIRHDGVPLPEHLPRQIVETARWDDWIDQEEEDIRLIDFDQCFLSQGAGLRVKGLWQPPDERAPETIFANEDEEVDWRVDLWHAGIIIYKCTFGGFVFEGAGIWGTPAELALSMIEVLDPLPAEWQDKWAEMEIQLAAKKHDRLLRYGKSPDDYSVLMPLEQQFVALDPTLEYPPFLLTLMQRLLRFRPADRIPAAQAVEELKREFVANRLLTTFEDSEYVCRVLESFAEMRKERRRWRGSARL